MFWIGFAFAAGVTVGVIIAAGYELSGRRSECERCEARQLWDTAHGNAWEAGSE